MTLGPDTHGVFAIAATPFRPDGAIDAESVDRLTDFYIGCGVDGLTVLGIMGEAPKLEPEEALAIVRRAVGRTGGRPVVVGVSAPGFAAMRSLALAAMDLGAAGVMVAPPSHLRTDDSIVAYYRQARQALGAGVPMVVQDYPLTLTVVMTPEVIRRIVEADGDVVMLKHEDWPGLDKISTLRGFTAAGRMRPISILAGNGGLFLDFETERGADGAMTGYAFPDMLVETVARGRAGEREAAHDLFDAHLPLIRYEQQQGIGLAVRKYVLMRRGAIASDAQRQPAGMLTEETRREVDYLLERLARRDPRARLPDLTRA